MTTTKQPEPVTDLTLIMLDTSIQIADKINAKAIFVSTEALNQVKVPDRMLKKPKLILVAKTEKDLAEARKVSKHVLQVPAVKLGRISQVKMAVIMGLSAGLVHKDDKIICLSQNPDDGTLDSFIVLDIGKEFELITSQEVADTDRKVRHDVFQAVLELALELANEGREGRPVGTIFVVGDHEKVMELSRQMIMNPFRGYEESERNILDPSLRETLKEFAALDGAFVIGDDGTILTSGRYLSASLEKADFPQGLGSRHLAAAGITDVTNAIAIAVSESTGTVRIFKGGNILVEIEKPAPSRK